MWIRNVFLLLILCSALTCAQSLHGVGSTFPYPLYSEWFKTYERANPGVKLHYKPTGTASGVRDFIDGKADFAATETPLTADQLQVAKQKLGATFCKFPRCSAPWCRFTGSMAWTPS
jgi:ABC-type phosphate transport system substrate-binding protein